MICFLESDIHILGEEGNKLPSAVFSCCKRMPLTKQETGLQRKGRKSLPQAKRSGKVPRGFLGSLLYMLGQFYCILSYITAKTYVADKGDLADDH